MKTPLKIAHEYGVKKALQECGYASVEDVHKEAAALGLFEAPAPAKTAGAPLEGVFQALQAKLG